MTQPDRPDAPPLDAFETMLDRLRETDASLNTRLRLLAEAVGEINPPLAAAVEVMLVRLDRAGLGAAAPAVGEPMPPFLLPDQNGRLVGLDDLLGEGPVVVSFLRGAWCPYCRLTTAAIAGVQDVIGAGRIVGVTPERGRRNAALIADAGARFRVLTDPDNGYALSLNLAYWVDDVFADVLRGIGVDLAASQAGAAWFLPVPATFVVDTSGLIVARHVDPDYRRRMEIDDLVAAYRAAE